jgi:hypothetical protein
MVRHAAYADVPHAVSKLKREDNFQGIPHVIIKIVEKHIPQTCAEDETDNGPYEEVLNNFRFVIIVFTIYPV